VLLFAQLAEQSSSWQKKEGVPDRDGQSLGALQKSAQIAEHCWKTADVFFVSISNADETDGEAGVNASSQATAEVDQEISTESQVPVPPSFSNQSPQDVTKEATQESPKAFDWKQNTRSRAVEPPRRATVTRAL
jgi:hypothetical protein